MKRILVILVLLLFGFSNSSFADKLPTTLFGVPILEHFEEHLIEDNVTRGICINEEKGQQYFTPQQCFKDFLRNESFETYLVSTDEQGIINNIKGFRFISVGYKTGVDINVCYEEKTNLIETLSILYEIDKNRFSQKFFKVSFENEETKKIIFLDRSLIKYNKGNDAIVLKFQCLYNRSGVIYTSQLVTEELFLQYNDDLIEIDTINLEVFNTDLSGY